MTKNNGNFWDIKCIGKPVIGGTLSKLLIAFFIHNLPRFIGFVFSVTMEMYNDVITHNFWRIKVNIERRAADEIRNITRSNINATERNSNENMIERNLIRIRGVTVQALVNVI